MSSMAGRENVSADFMPSAEPGWGGLCFDEQTVQDEVGKMGLPLLSRQSPQPVIEFAIVDDSDSSDEGDDDDGHGDGEYGFFTGVVSSPGDDEDDWSDCSSDYSGPEELSWPDIHGGFCLDPRTWTAKPFYRFVHPDPRTSCNPAAAALKEPLSLLTKYRWQRLCHRSGYFHESMPSPSKRVRWARQVTRGSPLKQVQAVRDQTLC